MTKTTQTARERIGHALYLLRAGSDPEVFLKTLRAYVLQHIETEEQMTELLHDLSSVNPHDFVAAVQTFVGRPLTKARVDDSLRAIIDGDGPTTVKHVKRVKVAKPLKRSSARLAHVSTATAKQVYRRKPAGQ